MTRADILAVVEDQFYELRKRLDIQLTRTGELQAQIDSHHNETVTLRQQVDLVHGLLKNFMAKEA